MNAKVVQRRSQRKNHKTSQKRSQRATSNVRVLRPKRRTRLSTSRIAMLGIFIAFIAWSVYPVTYRLEKNHELASLNKQLLEVEKQNDKLRTSIKRLSSDEYVETQARKLGLTKADEEMVVIVDENSDGSMDEMGDKVDKKAEGNAPASLWQRFMSFFSHVF